MHLFAPQSSRAHRLASPAFPNTVAATISSTLTRCKPTRAPALSHSLSLPLQPTLLPPKKPIDIFDDNQRDSRRNDSTRSSSSSSRKKRQHGGAWGVRAPACRVGWLCGVAAFVDWFVELRSLGARLQRPTPSPRARAHATKTHAGHCPAAARFAGQAPQGQRLPQAAAAAVW